MYDDATTYLSDFVRVSLIPKLWNKHVGSLKSKKKKILLHFYLFLFFSFLSLWLGEFVRASIFGSLKQKIKKNTNKVQLLHSCLQSPPPVPL